MRDLALDPAVLARLLAALANHGRGPSLPPTQPTSPQPGGVGLFGGIPAGDPAAAPYLAQPDPYALGRPRRPGDPGWPWMP